MFTRGQRGRGMAGLGEFVNQQRKVEYWLPNTFAGGSAQSVIPGVTNTTSAVGGGIVAALAAAYAAYKFLK